MTIAATLPILRPAATDDAALLFGLFSEVKAAEFLAMNLEEWLLERLLTMQYQARCSSYRELSPQAIQFVILHHEGSTIGQILLQEQMDVIRIIDFAIAADQRRQGAGNSVIRGLQEHATASAKRIDLQVAVDTPAMRFYEQLGFQTISRDEVFQCMEWKPEGHGRNG